VPGNRDIKILTNYSNNLKSLVGSKYARGGPLCVGKCNSSGASSINEDIASSLANALSNSIL